MHKSEFAKLEATSAKQVAQLRMELSSEKDRLKAYDQLEVEMDSAILQTGALEQPFREDTASTFALIPTAPKRRV